MLFGMYCPQTGPVDVLGCGVLLLWLYLRAMTRMARTFIVVALAGFAGSALAQTTTTYPNKLGARLKIAYFSSQKFELRSGGNESLVGPQISLDVPLSRMRGFDLFVTPSIGFGGQLSHGSDIDGNVYRFMLTARKVLNDGGLTGSLSAGFGHTESRGTNAFRDGDGLVGEVALAFPLKGLTFLREVTPGFEFAYSFSRQEQLRAFSFGFTFGF